MLFTNTHAEFYNRNGVTYNLELSGTYTLIGTKLYIDFGGVIFDGNAIKIIIQ